MVSVEVKDADTEFIPIIEGLGVTFVDDTAGRLPEGWWGGYIHSKRIIYVNPRLAPIQRRSVLAHELGHAVHRHDGRQDAIGEQEACECAANFLIPSPTSFGPAALEGNLRGLLSHRLRVMRDDITTYMRLNGARRCGAH